MISITNIRAFGQSNQLSKLKRYYDEFVQQKPSLIPNSVINNSMLYYYAQTGEKKNLQEFYQRYFKNAYPDHITFHTFDVLMSVEANVS